MAKKKHLETEAAPADFTFDPLPEAASTEPLSVYALLVGNLINGFVIYPLDNGGNDDSAPRWACHVPEARMVEVRAFEELIDKYGQLPEPANTTPKTKLDTAPAESAEEITDGDDGGPTGGDAEETPAGDIGSTGNGDPK